MLEVRAVEHAGCQHDDLGVPNTLELFRGQRHEQPAELVGIVVNWKNRLPLEQIGERSLGDRPILQQVAGTGWNTQIVFEHVDDSIRIANKVAATDVGPHAELR